MRRMLTAVTACMVLAASGTAFAQDTKPAGQGQIPEIRKLLAEMEASFSRGDAKRLAACWTPGGDFVAPTGQRVAGREHIQKSFQEFFKSRQNSKLQLQILSLRVVNDELALVDATPQVQRPAAEAADEAALSLVLVKREHGWLIESAREMVRSGAAQARPLKDLEWMVGEWADEAAQSHGISVHSTCDWTANQAFLIRKFKVEREGGVVRAGTEVIGWDPRTRRIRSWVFDTHGGFGENTWVRDGNRWLISYRGTRADGGEVSATTILTVLDADTVTLQSKDRTADDQRQPDVPPITIKRQPAAAAAPKGNDSKQPSPPPVLP